jgi:hypothetical protein
MIYRASAELAKKKSKLTPFDIISIMSSLEKLNSPELLSLISKQKYSNKYNANHLLAIFVAIVVKQLIAIQNNNNNKNNCNNNK